MGTFKVVKLRRIFWVTAIACVLVVAVAFSGAAIALAANDRRLPIYCVEDDVNVAITFDAAWGADKTKGIVDVLAAHDAKATFFLTGFWIEAYPTETLYVLEHGMQVGNHSANHKNMGKMSMQACMVEIAKVNTQLFDLANLSPTVFRAPFGDYGNNLLETLDLMEMRCIQWDVDSLDWKGLSAGELTRRVLSNCKGGSIILCHNNSDHILEALPSILDGIHAKGYNLVTIDELLAGKSGAIDHTGRLLQG